MTHFEGKSVRDHLKAARKKGAFATFELHGTELPGYIFAAVDALKETAIALMILWILFTPSSFKIFFLFSFSWLIWKTGRSAFLGWSRLERLHRLIEEERWEIQHNREEEKQELTALYKAKGLSGKLLEDVVSIFMSDDNRLLRLMLEEEMGLTLEVYEHPLKQCAGAFFGVVLSSAIFMGAWILHPLLGPMLASFSCISFATFVAAKKEQNRILEALVWTLSLSSFSLLALYFLKEALFS